VRKVLLLVCILAMPYIASGRTNKADWANLGALQRGQKIQIVEVNSKVHSGTFVSVSDTAIAFSDKSGEQSIQKQDVHSVVWMKNKHRLRNTLIGAGVGLGAGVGIGVAVNNAGRDPNFLPEAAPAILGVVGLVTGALVGVLLITHEVIYHVK
jgi:hypothetical protein